MLGWQQEGTPRAFLTDYYFFYDTIKAAAPEIKVCLNFASHLNGNGMRLLLATGGRDKFDEVGINMFNPPQGIWPGTLAVMKEAGITGRGIYENNYAGFITAAPTGAQHIAAETADAVGEVKNWVHMLVDFPMMTFAAQWDTALAESNANMTYRRHLKPCYVAYANMTGQLGAGTFTKTVVFPGGSLYVRQRGERPGLVGVMWADEREATVELGVGVPRVTLVDLWGNMREVATPGGVLTTRVGPEPLYVVGAKTLELAPSLRLSMRQATVDSRHPMMEVRLSNQKKEAVSGTLEVRPEGALSLGAHSFRFDRLAPGVSQAFLVEMHPVFPDRDEAQMVRAVVRAGGRTYEALQGFRFAVALHAATAPKIDGVLDEWPADAPALVSDCESHLARYGDERPWRGPEDFSGRLWLKWDRDNLYLAARVKDSGLTSQANGIDLWRGDGIEARLMAESVIGPQANPLHFALGHLGDGGGAYWYNGGNGQPAEGLQPGVTVKASYANHEHIHEAAIPWRLVTASKFDLASRHETNLHFSFNDGDYGHNRMMWWVHTLGDGDMALFGRIVLVGNAEDHLIAPANLFPNGDFSASVDAKSGLPVGFSAQIDAVNGKPCATAGVDSAAPLYSPALFVDRTVEGGCNSDIAGWTVPVEPDHDYLLTGKVRVADVQRAGTVVMDVVVVDEAGRFLKAQKLLALSPRTSIQYGHQVTVAVAQAATAGWQPGEAIIHTPPGAKWLPWRFHAVAGLGKLWVDDVGLYPLG